MVAYGFKRQFVGPIQVGLGQIERIDGTEYQPKRQTIRADRKRHARPGEQLQLYCGMRTKQCFLIGRAVCLAVSPVEIMIWGMAPDARDEIRIRHEPGAGHISVGNKLDDFARLDGFDGWAQMRSFWIGEHFSKERGAVPMRFSGVIINWRPLTNEEADPEGPAQV